MSTGTISFSYHGEIYINNVTKVDIHVRSHDGSERIFKSDNLLFYRVENHINAFGTFKCLLPDGESPNIYTSLEPSLPVYTQFFFDRVFVPYLVPGSGNRIVEQDDIIVPPKPAIVPSVYPPNHTAYGFGCLHMPLASIAPDGRVNLGTGSMIFNIGISDATLLIASGRMPDSIPSLPVNIYLFSGTSAQLVGNEYIDGILSSMVSPIVSRYSINYDCLHVYPGGYLLPLDERRGLSSLTDQEVRRVFETCSRRYISLPIFTWTTLIGAHDGRWDTDFDPMAMKNVMLHYRRSRNMDIGTHIVRYFDKFPRQCTPIQNGLYYAYIIGDRRNEHTYQIMDTTAVWKSPGQPPTTYDISYDSGTCLFETSIMSRLTRAQ